MREFIVQHQKSGEYYIVLNKDQYYYLLASCKSKDGKKEIHKELVDTLVKDFSWVCMADVNVQVKK